MPPLHASSCAALLLLALLVTLPLPSRACSFEVGDKFFDHFILPSDFRLNDLLAEAGLAFRLLRVVVPPLDNGFL